MSYWNAISQVRVSRRRAIVATSGTAAGSLLLAACGGSKSGGGTSSAPAKNESSLVATPVDTTKQAKVGGSFKWYSPSEPAHFDIHQGLNPLNTPANLTNDFMVNEKPNLIKPPEYSEVVPDLAESWEWAPDRLTLTLKLRDGVKWHNKALWRTGGHSERVHHRPGSLHLRQQARNNDPGVWAGGTG